MYSVNRQELSWPKTSFFTGFWATMALLSACADLGDPVRSIPPGANNPPVLESVGERFAAVNNVFQLVVSASDAESIPSLMTSNLPAGATFVDSGNGHGLLSWTPMPIFANTVNAVTIIATDDSLAADTEIVALNVIDYTFDSFVGPQVTVFCTDVGCHGSGSMASGFSAISFVSFKAGGFGGAGIVPQDTATSVVYQRLRGTTIGSRMPLDARIPVTGFFPSTTLDSIARWILAGAPES